MAFVAGEHVTYRNSECVVLDRLAYNVLAAGFTSGASDLTHIGVVSLVTGIAYIVPKTLVRKLIR